MCDGGPGLALRQAQGEALMLNLSKHADRHAGLADKPKGRIER
jgi:hypothetical protein